MAKNSISITQKRDGNISRKNIDSIINKHLTTLRYGALVLGIMIIIGGFYILVWGITPSGDTDDEDDAFTEEGGCLIALGMVIITTGGLFITYYLRKRRVSPETNRADVELKVCAFCNKRVEVDQELCYHCGHEFK